MTRRIEPTDAGFGVIRTPDRKRAHMNPEAERTRHCAVAGCDRPYRSGGFCRRHLDEARKRGHVPDLRFRENRPAVADVPCRVEGCTTHAKYRGQRLCNAHYLRLWSHGTTDLPVAPTIAERLEAGKVVVESGCWEWQGTLASTGYGKIGDLYVHRESYALHVGPIPAGLQIDHLCFNRACFNPEHLEAVTQAENVRRENARMQRDPDTGRILPRTEAH